MSAIGTGVAAGVAQTALQSQQVARNRDRREAQNAADTARLQDLVEMHLRALEEGDETETPAQLHIDGQLPEHESANQQDSAEQNDEQRPAEQGQQLAAAVRAAAVDMPALRQALYHHLDVKA